MRAVDRLTHQAPLGSNAAPSRVDVRFICATNRDLPAMVKGGKFRDDLFFRVGVITVDCRRCARTRTTCPFSRRCSCSRPRRSTRARCRSFPPTRWSCCAAGTTRATCAS
ncbi:MAG: hypothetical protein DI536_15440 [Archangium gephyra]|uniref:Sigma-54 factor interaction domain-containing protein n=1 Tax=Archangium gephyra TaxID=48 RepID=A0A2W5TLW7_9BACT|nr:MAG: hypothetical protein DI536_15440 [Archangium gephyra]